MGKIYEIFANNLKMQIFSDEQEKYINDEKRIYTKILLVRLKDDKLIKTTNSLIEEARIIAQEKYQSLGNNKELSRAEKIKISEDYANEQLEKNLICYLKTLNKKNILYVLFFYSIFSVYAQENWLESFLDSKESEYYLFTDKELKMDNIDGTIWIPENVIENSEKKIQ